MAALDRLGALMPWEYHPRARQKDGPPELRCQTRRRISEPAADQFVSALDYLDWDASTGCWSSDPTMFFPNEPVRLDAALRSRPISRNVRSNRSFGRPAVSPPQAEEHSRRSLWRHRTRDPLLREPSWAGCSAVDSVREGRSRLESCSRARHRPLRVRLTDVQLPAVRPGHHRRRPGRLDLAKAMAEAGAEVLLVEREAVVFRDRIRGETIHPWGVAEAKIWGV